MATQVQRPQANGVTPKKLAAPRPAGPPTTPKSSPAKPRAPNSVPRAASQKAAPVQRKAASVAGGGDHGGQSVTGAYAIMAGRLANRVAELAEGITFVERPKPNQNLEAINEKKPPRKLEMRLQQGSADSIAFSAPFLDNTLQKMLLLQNRMLTTTADLSKSEGVSEKLIKEHASQSAELSRIIALICAEKARQGA